MDSDLDDIDGSILKIHVRNFFCHDNLEINLNKNVNFIVGRNGSGKSAVLTALIVGLGARAAATNRGNSIVSFIKKGTNSATIEIKIKNSSPKAYKHNVYGDTITIVRNISSSGSSTYKVKNDSGEVVSNKLEEVHAVTLAHDIQVDNPISVLNQDDARSFHASDAKKKYSLFRKATNLDQTELNYVRALDNCQRAKGIWIRKNEAFQVLEKELRKWEACYEAMQSRDEIEAKQRKLQDEYYWSEVAEFEAEINAIQREYDKQNEKIHALKAKLDSIASDSASGNSVLSKLMEKLQSKTVRIESVETKLSEHEEKKRIKEQELRAVNQKQKKIREQMARESSKVKDLRREIDQISSGEAESHRAALEAQFQQLEESIKMIRARLTTGEHHCEQTRQNAEISRQKADDYTVNKRHLQQQIKKVQMQLGEIDSRSSDSLSVYGRNMVDLVKRIKQAHAQGKFSQMPRGPVGSFLKVKDKKWGGVMEHIIGGSMLSFCVNTPEDSRLVFKIMNEVYGSAHKPGVTCCKFVDKVHDVSRTKVRANSFVSALDAIDVSDPNVANFLIDNISMEHTLLVPDHEDAIRLSEKQENVPVNCKRIVTLDCTDYHPAPNYRCYGGSGKTPRYLQTSSAERKRQLQAEIQNLETDLNKLDRSAMQAEQEAVEAKKNANDASKVLISLRAEFQKKETALSRLKDQMDVQQPIQQQFLVEELQVSENRLSSFTEELKQLEQKEEEVVQKLKQHEAIIKQIDEQKKELSLELGQINEEVGEEQLKIDRGVSEKSSLEARITQHKEKAAKVKQAIDEKSAILQSKVEAAEKLCARVDNAREKNVVVTELKALAVKLKSMQNTELTKAEVAETLLNIQRKYQNTKHMLDKLRGLITDVRKSSNKHLEYCRRVQNLIASRVQFCFQTILTLRGYSGSMDINNVKETLEISCSGRDPTGKRLAASTSSLSGGERSYATVAFIMALWECVELPFYFMDEFDVFMDNVNRKIVMDLLLDHALKNKNRQFCFLTPQDASSVTSGPYIKIHRMANPRS